jgi:hypothetical protein
VHLRDLTPAQRQLLEELTKKISRKLDAIFTELADADGPSIGVQLRERGVVVVAEVPGDLLIEATTDATAREALRVRLKARRDRMLFKPPPAALSKRITPAADPGGSRSTGGAPRGRGRR